MVAPLIAEDDEKATPPSDSAGPAGAQTGSKTGREIGTAWIHPTRPSWVYVSITDPHSDTADHATHGASVPTDEPVTCTLVQRDGVSFPLGTFSLRNGHADWSAPTPIDSQSLAQAQLTVTHGHTLARASFAAPTTSQADSGHYDKNPNKSHDKDTSKEKDKDKNPSQGKDKHSQNKEQSSRNHDKKDQSGGDQNDKIPTGHFR
jgi:hypothetical protein